MKRIKLWGKFNLEWVFGPCHLSMYSHHRLRISEEPDEESHFQIIHRHLGSAPFASIPYCLFPSVYLKFNSN